MYTVVSFPVVCVCACVCVCVRVCVCVCHPMFRVFIALFITQWVLCELNTFVSVLCLHMTQFVSLFMLQVI